MDSHLLASVLSQWDKLDFPLTQLILWISLAVMKLVIGCLQTPRFTEVYTNGSLYFTVPAT